MAVCRAPWCTSLPHLLPNLDMTWTLVQAMCRLMGAQHPIYALQSEVGASL